MTYNYFNAGRLAFGKKITSVFNSLNQLLFSAQVHFSDILDGAEYYAQFTRKNYLCPEPNRADMPARTNEILNLFNGYTFFNNVSSDGSTTTFNITLFDTSSSKITVATGSTTVKTGYAFVKRSTNRDDFQKDIRFSTNDTGNEGEILICNFTVDGTDVYIIDPATSDLNLISTSRINYRSLAITQVGFGGYTCNSRAECIIVSMINNSPTGFSVSLNGVLIFGADSLQFSQPYTVLYLRKGDVLTGVGVGNIYKVSYIK